MWKDGWRGRLSHQQQCTAVAHGSPTCCTLVYMSFTFLHQCTLYTSKWKCCWKASSALQWPHGSPTYTSYTFVSPYTPFYTFGHPPSGKIAEEKDYLTSSERWVATCKRTSYQNCWTCIVWLLNHSVDGWRGKIISPAVAHTHVHQVISNHPTVYTSNVGLIEICLLKHLYGDKDWFQFSHTNIYLDTTLMKYIFMIY